MNPNKLTFGRAMDSLEFLSLYGKALREPVTRGGPYTQKIENMLNAPRSIRFSGKLAAEASVAWRNARDVYGGKRSNLEL